MHLNIPTESDFSNVDSIGVALAQYPGEQNHIAILFQSVDDEAMLLHVGEHKGELLEKPSCKYVWLDLSKEFNPIRKQVILGHIQHIAEVNKDAKVRYGLDHGVFCLDAETGMLNGNYDETIGFTCATFVIEVFLSCGITLLDWDTWPSGVEEHTKFQRMVFTYLSQQHSIDPKKVTLEYLTAQQEKIGTSRFLPQEVAAATQSSKPSTKEDVDPIASDIYGELTTYTTALYGNS